MKKYKSLRLCLIISMLCFCHSSIIISGPFGERSTPKAIRNGGWVSLFSVAVFWGLWETSKLNILSSYQCSIEEKAYCCEYANPVINATVSVFNPDNCVSTNERESRCGEGKHMFCRKENQNFGLSVYQYRSGAYWLFGAMSLVGAGIGFTYASNLIDNYGLRELIKLAAATAATNGSDDL